MALPTYSANPLANVNIGTAAGPSAPNLGVTAGSASGGGGLTQGTPLPNITTTQQQATATPQFYTNYLNQLAQQGATAAQGAQFANATPLQEQAFGKVQSDVGNYQPALDQAQSLAGDVGNSNIAQALGNLNQSNIANYLAPQATAGIVGTGQFGSARGAGALGQVINQADIATQAQQAQAMQTDMQNRLAAANQLNSIAGQTQALGLGDVNALATLGGQQQTIAQNAQLFPMQQLTSEANLLKGATIPTATSSSYTGPIPGAYNASPLSQIAGLGSLASGVSDLIPSINKALPTINFSNPFSTTPSIPGTSGTGANAGGSSVGAGGINAGSTTGSGNANGTNITGSTGTGDQGAQSPTMPDGSPNPNYDPYADPNATQADINAFNNQQIADYNAANNANTPYLPDPYVQQYKKGGEVNYRGHLPVARH